MTTMLSHRVSLVACALVLAGVAACGNGGGDGDEDSMPAPSAHVTAGLQQVLNEAVKTPDVLLPGAIANYREPGHAPWSGGAGLGDLKTHAAIRFQDRIRAGSILKTFLATVTLQHVEEGTLSLDQTLTELLPKSVTDRVKNADQITLRMLLNHTSGIPEWTTKDIEARVFDDPAHVWTTDEVLDIVAQKPAEFAPGSSWKYSNTDYNLVGLVLDRLGEHDWRTQVRKRVIERLDLRSTYLPEPGDLTVHGGYVHGYQEIDGTPMDVSLIDSSMAGAAGGHALITTVDDLGRFLEALLDGQLFERPGSLKAMTTMVDAQSPADLPYKYGLGLESYEMPNGMKVIGNSGGAGGYTTMMYKVVDRGSILVTSVNTSDLFTNALDVFMPALDVLADDKEEK